LREFTLELSLTCDGPLAVAGPSGAGKSTLLRLLAGLDTPTHGRIEVDGERWFGGGVDLPAERRRVGFVFQEYALFPHLDVRANVGFGAEGRPVDDLLERLGIARLARQRPGRLSGGERQRVALARALARRPKLLLLDEPLSALDPATRGTVGAELASILRESGLPALVVSHSFDDAAVIAPQMAVIERGRITQEGSVDELLASPATPFVAQFAGTNHLTGNAVGRLVSLDQGGEVLLAEPHSGPVAVLIAPWEVTLDKGAPPPTGSALNHIRGRVQRLGPFGSRVRVVLDGGLTAEITKDSAERMGLATGDEVVASFKATGTRVVSRAPN